MIKQKLLLIVVLSIFFQIVHAQYLMDMVDTTKDMGKGFLEMYKKLGKIKLSGYIQPQFQIAQSKGDVNYSGGDFAINSNNRFMLKASRVKLDYINFTKSEKIPSVQFVFQFDATERGVFVKDVWGRIFENKLKLFSFTTGLFDRPFSYELNMSSGDIESIERGRMSQILMKSEKDIGAMVSFENRNKNGKLNFLKADIGIFNGPGLTATTDYDNHKDIIGRVSLKPQILTKKITFSAAASILYGGINQNTKYIYTTQNYGGIKSNIVDSSTTNINQIAPRKYYGVDAQFKIKNHIGFTVIRAEYILGKQTASLTSSETPTTLFSGNTGYYVRNFNGAYFYFIQHLGSLHHQIVIKYDWYDPNIKVAKNDIGKTGSNLNAADIKYTTLGVGYIYNFTENAKLVLWYDKIANEKTQLAGFTNDIKDNIFTCRLQFKF